MPRMPGALAGRVRFRVVAAVQARRPVSLGLPGVGESVVAEARRQGAVALVDQAARLALVAASAGALEAVRVGQPTRPAKAVPAAGGLEAVAAPARRTRPAMHAAQLASATADSPPTRRSRAVSGLAGVAMASINLATAPTPTPGCFAIHGMASCR